MFLRCIAFLLFLFISSFPSLIFSQQNYSSTGCILSDAYPLPIWETLKFPSHLTSIQQILDILCPPAFHCPLLNLLDNSTYPVICPPTIECFAQRLENQFCSPQGKYEPILCPQGVYCPNQYELIDCPKNYYCPLGTIKPLPCDLFSYCPMKSSKQIDYTSILLFILIDFLIVLLYIYLRIQWKNKKLNHLNNYNNNNNNNNNNNVNMTRNDDWANNLKEIYLLSRKRFSTLLQSTNSKNNTDNNNNNNNNNSDNNDNNNANNSSSSTVSDSLGLSVGISNFSVSLRSSNSSVPERVLVQPISLEFPPGKISAILGASGSGKTTLFHGILGRLPDSVYRVTGTVNINGIPVDSNDLRSPLFQSLCAFVPQTDQFNDELTLYENLYYSAHIRLPKLSHANNGESNGWNEEIKEKLIYSIIHALNLIPYTHSYSSTNTISLVSSSSAANSEFSAGIRKRINIALELVAGGMLLFLDEPTSSLSSALSLELIRLLKYFSLKIQLTTLLIVHQPRIEIFNLLEYIVLLAPEGKLIYSGYTRFIEKYFNSILYLYSPQGKCENPADFYMDCIALNGEEMAKKWIETGEKWVKEQSRQLNNNNDNNNDSAATTTATTTNNNNTELYPNLNKSDNSSSSSSTSASSSPSASLSPLSFEIPLFYDSPGFLYQCSHSFRRSLLKQFRNPFPLLFEFLICSVSGFFLGLCSQVQYQGLLIVPFTLISPTPIEYSLPQSGMLISMGIALSATSSGVNIFGSEKEKLIFWKEFQSNHNSLAYYIGVWLAQIPRILLGSLHFTAISYIVNGLYMNYDEYFLLSYLLCSVWYGWSISIGFLFPHTESSLFAIVGGLIFCIFSGLITAIPYYVKIFSPAFWYSEGLYTAMTKDFVLFMEVNQISAPLWDYSINQYILDYFIIFLMWGFYFILGYLLMMREYRKKFK